MSSSSDERTENEKYKTFINSQLQENVEFFYSLRREKQLDYLFPYIKRDLVTGSTNLLDLCCGYGRLIYFLQEEFPQLTVHGIDYLESQVKKGQDHFRDNKKVSFEVCNAFDVAKTHGRDFDVTVIHKTISWLPYYENVVREALKVTRKKLYVTSLFWDGDIDFIMKVFKHASSNDGNNFSYLNTYSYPKFKRFCLENGAGAVNAENMHIDIDLPLTVDANQLQTFTVPTDNRRLEFTGPLQLNWKLIEICLGESK